MPRKPVVGADLAPEAPLDEQALSLVQNAASAVQGMAEERDLVNQLLGQAQMADAFSKFSKTVFISKLAFVKENKLYRALQGKSGEDGLQCQGTWEEFCNLLGWAPQHANEAINNLRAFGEEALESMSRMGIGYRELRQWRRLPDDARSALIVAAEQGNKEAVQYLAEELIATHTKEKTELENKLKSVQDDYEAQGEVLHKKSKDLDQTRQDLEKARRRIQTMAADEAAKELRQEVVGLAFEAEADISGKLREAFNALDEHAQETGTDHRHFQAQLVSHLVKLLHQLREEFHLPEVDAGSGIEQFPWLNGQGDA